MKQTDIPCPAPRHDYSRGLDEALRAQQLRDLLKVIPSIKVNFKSPRGAYYLKVLQNVKP